MVSCIRDQGLEVLKRYCAQCIEPVSWDLRAINQFNPDQSPESINPYDGP
jgi:hypothetical protein